VRRRLEDNKTVYVQSLGVNVDVVRMQCGACKELLARDFITMPCFHSACLQCIQKCIKDDQYSCPTCRQKTRHINYQDPILLALLRTYPRTVPCGLIINGCDAAADHTNVCVQCSKASLAELRNEYEALKKTNDATQAKLVMLEESNTLLREELSKSVRMNESESEDESTGEDD
jgi:hypothetical protein